jgi:hypothetical protein
MKNKLFWGCFVSMLFCACNKEILRPQSTDEKKQNLSSGFYKYTIPEGKQYCDKNTFLPVKIHQLAFKVRFDSSAVYKTRKAENQDDINKLFGFSDNNATHQQFSARFGWRWSDNALRLFAYNYNNGNRSFKEVATIEIGRIYTCSITIAGSEYIFAVNGVETRMPRESTTAMAEGYQLYPYFGGDETAPHDIFIWIEKL